MTAEFEIESECTVDLPEASHLREAVERVAAW